MYYTVEILGCSNPDVSCGIDVLLLNGEYYERFAQGNFIFCYSFERILIDENSRKILLLICFEFINFIRTFQFWFSYVSWNGSC